MQTISSADLSLLESYSPVHLHLYVGGTEIPAKLSTFNLTTAVGDEALNCGNSVASVMQVGAVAEEIYRGLVTRDGKAIVTRLGEQIMAKFLWNGLVGSTIGITWDVDGSTEYNLFQGKIEKCVVNSGRAQITAQDELFWNGSRLFAGQRNYQTTVSAQTVLETIASEMGVTLNAATSSLASDVSIYNGFSSCRDQLQLYQAAGYVAGILGGNAVINRDGELAVVRYATTSFSTEVYQGGSSAENENYAPSGVRFVRQITTRITNADGTISESDTIATYSAGDGSVEMENPLANKVAATRAYNALRSISSRKGTYSFPMGIQLEPGDVITVTTMDGTYPVAIVSQQLDIDGGVKSTVRGAGQMYPNGVNGTMTNTYTPTRNSMRSARLLGDTADEEDEPDTDADEIFVPGHVGPVTQRLNSLELEMLKVKNLQAENAEITNANIQNIKAGNIDVDALFARDITATGVFQVRNTAYSLIQSNEGLQLGPGVGTEAPMSYLKLTNSLAWLGSRNTITIESAVSVVIRGSFGVLIGGNLAPSSYYDTGPSLGTEDSRWETVYCKKVDIGGNPAVARQRKTVTGTTSSSGYISLGLGSGYRVLCVRRTDAGSICWPYWSTAASGWYAHLATTAATPAVVANTSVTLEVEYYAAT